MLLLQYSLRSTFRQPAQVVGLVLGLAACTLLFVLLRTIDAVWTHAAANTIARRVIVRPQSSVAAALPLRSAQRASDHPALASTVEKVTYLVWFAGRDEARPGELFASIAVSGAEYLDVVDETQVSPETRATFLRERNAAVIGDALAARMGWKAGDRVQLVSGLYPERKAWEFVVAGTYTAPPSAVDRSMFLFRYDYLNEALDAEKRDTISFIVCKLRSGVAPAEASGVISEAFASDGEPVVVQDERAYLESQVGFMSAVLVTMTVLSSVLAVVMFLLVLGRLSIAVRTRLHEYGVFLACGFARRHVLAVVAGEALTLSLAGAAVGLGASFALIDGLLGPLIEKNAGTLLPFFRVYANVAVGSAAAVAATGVLAGLIAAAIPLRRDAISLLRAVD